MIAVLFVLLGVALGVVCGVLLSVRARRRDSAEDVLERLRADEREWKM